MNRVNRNDSLTKSQGCLKFRERQSPDKSTGGACFWAAELAVPRVNHAELKSKLEEISRMLSGLINGLENREIGSPFRRRRIER